MADLTNVTLNCSLFCGDPNYPAATRFVLPCYSTPTGNPPTTSIAEGSIWYNCVICRVGIAVCEQNPAWGSANSMNVTRRFGSGMGASSNVGLAAGGLPAAPGARTNASEEYNGSNWVASNTINTARYFAAPAGSQNSAVIMGGAVVAPGTNCCTEEYNGTNWSAVTATPQTWNAAAAAGDSQNAATTWGGGANQATALSYNGTNYAAINSTNYSSNLRGGAGTSNSALSFSTGANIGVTCTELYNGVSWVAKAAAPVAMRNSYGFGASANAVAAVGGRANAPANNTACVNTRVYNGITDSWSTGPNMPAGRFGHLTFGTYNGGGAWGGNNPAVATGAEFELSGTAVVKFKYLCNA